MLNAVILKCFLLFESWLLSFNSWVDTNSLKPALQVTWSAGGSKWQQDVTVWHSWRNLRLFRHFRCKLADMDFCISLMLFLTFWLILQWSTSHVWQCWFLKAPWFLSGPPLTVCTTKRRSTLTQLAFIGLFFCSFLLHRPFRPP